ncbi:MAG: hypothetical protein ACE5KH_05610 [Candidatus Geothermarchaeales archaeon]
MNALAWKLSNNAVKVVWEGAWGCGISWAGYQNGGIHYITFSTYLTSGRTYQFYTYLSTYAMASALGFGYANARNNIGSGGDIAYLLYMYHS